MTNSHSADEDDAMMRAGFGEALALTEEAMTERSPAPLDESPTPKTDALYECHGGAKFKRETAYDSMLAHARWLERELSRVFAAWQLSEMAPRFEFTVEDALRACSDDLHSHGHILAAARVEKHINERAGLGAATEPRSLVDAKAPTAEAGPSLPCVVVPLQGVVALRTQLAICISALAGQDMTRPEVLIEESRKVMNESYEMLRECERNGEG